MNELVLFAGVGGGILGGKLCGFRCVCAVEIDPYARAVLAARQNDGSLAPFPIWDDVCTFRGDEWRGIVDVVSGGFPCQDISIAGKGAGINGAKSGLWREMARIICEVEPSFVIVENSPALLVRGFDVVLGDLAQMGFNARWGVFGADNVGAPHIRKRLFVVASHPNRVRQQQSQGRKQDKRRWVGNPSPLENADFDSTRQQGVCGSGPTTPQQPRRLRGCWWTSEPDVVRMVHGVPFGMDRIRGLGNAQVPAVVKLAWDTLTKNAP